MFTLAGWRALARATGGVVISTRKDFSRSDTWGGKNGFRTCRQIMGRPPCEDKVVQRMDGWMKLDIASELDFLWSMFSAVHTMSPKSSDY